MADAVISRTADTDDDGSGTTGTVHNNAWKSALYDAIDAAINRTEGTWTPTLIGSTSGEATYTNRFGAYSKNGQTVVASFYIAASGAGTLSGNMKIGGLPFTVNNLSALYGPVNACYWSGGNSNLVYMVASSQPNTTTALIYGAAAAAAGLTAVAVTFVTTGTTIIGTLVYRASA